MNLLEIFGVTESYRLPDAIMKELFSNEATKYIKLVKENKIDIRDVFQSEQGDRKKLKQDFTPDCICTIVTKLAKQGNCIDMCSGTGALSKAIAKEKQVDINEHEFSERAIPFALLDACVNGLTGFISRTDCLRHQYFKRYILTKKRRC